MYMTGQRMLKAGFFGVVYLQPTTELGKWNVQSAKIEKIKSWMFQCTLLLHVGFYLRKGFILFILFTKTQCGSSKIHLRPINHAPVIVVQNYKRTVFNKKI